MSRVCCHTICVIMHRSQAIAESPQPQGRRKLTARERRKLKKARKKGHALPAEATEPAEGEEGAGQRQEEDSGEEEEDASEEAESQQEEQEQEQKKKLSKAKQRKLNRLKGKFVRVTKFPHHLSFIGNVRRCLLFVRPCS